MRKSYNNPRIVVSDRIEEQLLDVSIAVDRNTEIDDPQDVRSRRFRTVFDEEK